MITKSKAWEYENEWRLMATKAFSEKDGDLRFWRFNPKLLKSIDLGARMGELEKNEVIAIARHNYPHATIREVVPDKMRYRIIYNPI